MRWRLALAGFALAWQIKAEDVPIRLRRPPGAITRFPGSMVDPALGLVKDTIKLAVKLKKALDAIRANDVECQNLQVLVAILIVILLRFENRGLMSHPAICTAALLWLRGSFYSALRQVTKWQRRKKPLRILTARNMAKQLSRVHNEIQQKMQLGSFAFTASILEITVETRYNGAHPPLTQPQLDAAGMENYSSNSTVAAGAGYPVEGLNEIITMLTTGTEMADLAVGTAWRDARLTTMKKAVRQNNLGCRELESCVVKVSGLLVLLNERTELKRHPVISASLMESLEQARELLTYFQKMNTLRLLLRAEGMANLLRQVQTNIQEKLTLASFAITITLNNSTIHPLATQLEDAGAVDLLSHISHSTFGDARCAVNSEVTTVARSGMRATIAKISRFIRPRTRRRRVAPSSSPLLIEEHPDTPVPAATIGRADDLLPFTSVSMAKPQQSLHSRRPTTSTTGLEAHFFGTPDPLLQQQQVEAALAALMQGLPESASPRPAMVGDHLYAMPDDPLLMRHQQRWHAPGPGWTGFPNRLRHNGQWQPETPPLPAPAAIPARGTATNNEKSVTDEASSSMSIKSGARRVFEKPDEPLLMQHQPEPAAPPATVPVRRRRRTVNVSSVHRAPRHSRMMRRTQPALSSQRWGARALHQLLVVPCALCALVLLACVWALRY